MPLRILRHLRILRVFEGFPQSCFTLTLCVPSLPVEQIGQHVVAERRDVGARMQLEPLARQRHSIIEVPA